MLQIVTGIWLAMHYTPHIAYAFDSVEHIMRDVNYGWLLRYAHANGASMFFIVVYIHIARGLYYGSYKSPREVLVDDRRRHLHPDDGLGVPRLRPALGSDELLGCYRHHQPILGYPAGWRVDRDMVVGRFAIDNATLNRFFALHYLIPFTILGMVILHLWALHRFGSNNPVGIDITKKDKIPFHPYYTLKDMFGLSVFFIVFAIFVFFSPNLLGHPDNYIPANPLVTPSHIVPEWYFLPFYAILRAITFDILWIIPAKLGGVLAMFGADRRAVRAAVARHLADPQRQVPADLQVGLLRVHPRRLPARLRGQPSARRDGSPPSASPRRCSTSRTSSWRCRCSAGSSGRCRCPRASTSPSWRVVPAAGSRRSRRSESPHA
jgi:hypothetical protein